MSRLTDYYHMHVNETEVKLVTHTHHLVVNDRKQYLYIELVGRKENIVSEKILFQSLTYFKSFQSLT